MNISKTSITYYFLAFSLLVLSVWFFNVSLGPKQITLAYILSPPDFFNTNGIEGILGYDELGRSVFSRLIKGAIPAFTIAILVVLFSMLIGVTIGLIAAFFGGWVDMVVVRIIDVFLAFPGLLLAIILSGILGPGLFNVVIALCAVGWVGFARITRAQTLSLRQRDFVVAATSQGQKTSAILYRHIFPLTMAPLLVEATFAFAGSILAEAGLSFLGLGVQPPDPSWGQMIRIGAQYMLTSPHYVLAPSIALWATVLAINYCGDSLQRRYSHLN
jgi:peptide/nickel transport system permease protein